MIPVAQSLPLQGVRILAIEQYGAAPYGSLFLAQLGAQVIKIEQRDTGGDISRRIGPYLLGEDDSEFFQTFNANKQSLTLNLKDPAGREVFERLITRADAVIHNLRGDLAAKLRLTYSDLGPIAPRLVCGHLSAYGREGERAAWPGYDYLMQAEAGFLHLTGEPGGPPVRFGLSVIDYMTGLMLASAVMAGIIKARSGGTGCDVDVSLFDAAIHQLSYLATWYLNEGHITKSVSRSAHPSIAPSQLVRTQDGWLFVMCQTQKFWVALAEAVDGPALLVDPRFATPKERLEHRAALTGELDAIFQREPTAVWLERLRGVVPVSPVLDLEQALENPYVATVGMVAHVAHPQRGALRVLANPVRVNGERLPVAPAPALGADTGRLLAEAGYSPEEIAQLQRRGAV